MRENAHKILNLALFIILSLFFTFQNATYGQSITSFSCTVPAAVANWPRNVFSSTCSIAINRNGQTGLKVGIYATSYNTNRISGTSGPTPIDYRTPENPTYRFQANGPLQGGTPANINTSTTVATGILLVKNNINTNADASFSFPVLYTTYEADIGDTRYRQIHRVRVFRSNNVTAATTASQNYNFTIANRQYVTISAPAAITLANSNQVFTTGQYYDSNAYTVGIRANNTWALTTRLTSNLVSGVDTMPVSNQYFRCAASGSFTCTASTRTQYATAGTYYNVANNNSGVLSTGTADNINLSSMNVSMTNSLLNPVVFKKGNYATTINYFVNSPNP